MNTQTTAKLYDKAASQLADHCALIRLRARFWTGQATDAQAAGVVEQNAQAKQGTARVTKYLVDRSYIDSILRPRNKARKFIEAKSAPWAATGARIIPASDLPEVLEELGKFKADFEEAVGDLVDDYDALINEARLSMGALFDSALYPDQLQERFSLQVMVSAVPTKNEFRFQLPDHVKESLDHDFSNIMTDAVEDMQRSLIKQCAAPLNKLVAKLTDPNAKQFHATTFSNLQDAADLVDRLNVLGDADITAAVNGLRSLTGINVGAVKDDKAYRAQVASKAKTVAGMSVFAALA